MSLWTIRPNQNHDVYTVVYLLREWRAEIGVKR